MDATPPPDQLAELHRLLLAGDAAAPAMFAEAVIDVLMLRVQSQSQQTRDPQLVADASVDAVMDFIKEPQKYDPGGRNVLSFLEMAARRNLANSLVSLRRQKRRNLRVGAVALRESARNERERRPLERLSDQEQVRVILDAIDAELSRSFSSVEVAVLRLIADGVRDTARYAAILGCSDEPPAVQRRLVKQVKDRLTKRLKRSLPDSTHDEPTIEPS